MVRRAVERLRGSPAEVAWVVAGQCAAAIGALVGVRVLTHVLPPSEYGVLALALTVGALTQQIVFGPVSNAVLRFYAASDERAELRSMLRAAARLFAQAVAVLAVCAMATALVPMLRISASHGAVVAASVAFACVSGLNGVLAAAHSAARNRSAVAVHQGLAEVLRYTLAVVAIRIAGPSTTMALLGFAAGIGICAASQSILLWRMVRGRSPETDGEPNTSEHESKWRHEIVRYSKPFALWGGFTWAALASDRWSLQAFQTSADVGRYAALFQLGSYPVTMGASMLVQLVAPVLFARASDASDPTRLGHARTLNFQLTALVLAATVLATCAAALLHRPLFHLLVGESYRSVSWLLPAVVLGAGVFAAGQQLALTLLTDLRANRLLLPKIGSAIAGMGFYFAGARWWGIPGVVVAGILFALVHLGWVALASRDGGTFLRDSASLVAAAPPERLG